MSESNLKSKITKGVIWGGGGRIVQQIIQFALSVALARLLSPGDYGLMAMVMVFTGFAGMLADGGFNSALIQKKDMTDAHVHTVFWINFVLGILLLALTFLLAPLLADFYQVPQLKDIFRVIAINFVISAFGNVPSAILQKELRFNVIAKIDTTAVLLSGVLAICMAWGGFGVWSLVAQPILAGLIMALMRCWACKWFPKFLFNPTALKEIWGFSGNMFGFLFINYWARNADSLIIGKVFGSASLGLYNRAYGLMLLPITQVHGAINQVMFPVLSSIQDDKERVGRIYLRAVGIITLVSYPMMMGLCVVAEPFVLTLYGTKWSGVSSVLQILALVGLIQSLVSSGGLLLLSQGRADRLLFSSAVFYILHIAAFFIGTALGSVYAVAVCYAAANLITAYPSLIICGRAVGLSANQIVSTSLGPFLCALGMSAVVYIVQLILPLDWAPGFSLAILVAVGIVVYMVLVLAFNLTAWQDFRQIIREKIGR